MAYILLQVFWIRLNDEYLPKRGSEGLKVVGNEIHIENKRRNVSANLTTSYYFLGL